MNTEYDNDNNPYIKIRAYLKVSSDDGSNYIEVPMIKCDNQYMPQILKDNDYPGQFYCPDFEEEQELFANYLYQDHSYFRLAFERCNNETIGITCATKEQIDEYAYMNKIGVQGRIGTSNLGAEDTDKGDLKANDDSDLVVYTLMDIMYSSAFTLSAVRG